MPRIFALAHGEGHAAYCFQPTLVLDNQVLRLEDFFLGLRGTFVHGEDDFAADHHGCQLMFAGLRRRGRADHLAGAHDGDAIGDRQDFLELVGDEDDRNTLLGQLVHDAGQIFRFLRGQHGGRLVEDQDAGFPVERLDDLHALLHTDGKIADNGFGVNIQAVFMREFPHHIRDCFAFQPVQWRNGSRAACPVVGFGAQHDVFGDREDRDEHEVLVHHADAV